MSFYWKPYVSVATRRARSAKKMDKLRKSGKKIEPVEIEGRTIAKSFWGKAWCDHLESFSDYDNRLPRGRTYARNGSVCHLKIVSGEIRAYVTGSELYEIVIKIEPLKKSVWNTIKSKCSGKIGSMLELLQGKMSDNIMEIVTDRDNGLMPLPKEIKLACSCPDWAVMCKHVAAVMYGVGNRLDSQPELLFLLRGADPGELISGELNIAGIGDGTTGAIASDKLAGIFGDDIEFGDTTEPVAKEMQEPVKKVKGKTSVKKVNVAKSSPKPGKSKKKVVKTVAKAVKTIKPVKETPVYPAKVVTRRVSVTHKINARNCKDIYSATLSGKAIRQLRNATGLSVVEFATELGVSTTSIYNWEKNLYCINFSISTKSKIAALAIRHYG